MSDYNFQNKLNLNLVTKTPDHFKLLKKCKLDKPFWGPYHPGGFVQTEQLHFDLPD